MLQARDIFRRSIWTFMLKLQNTALSGGSFSIKCDLPQQFFDEYLAKLGHTIAATPSYTSMHVTRDALLPILWPHWYLRHMFTDDGTKDGSFIISDLPQLVLRFYHYPQQKLALQGHLKRLTNHETDEL